MNLREIINAEMERVRSDIDPNTAIEIALNLSSMISTLLDHVSDRRQSAYAVMAMAIENDMPIGKAEAFLKASNEYKEYKSSEGYYIGVLETIRTLRGKARQSERELLENIN